jgi:lipopolysaccharide/colanic/teichoic acid biosynthesis glycosyltransferase
MTRLMDILISLVGLFLLLPLLLIILLIGYFDTGSPLFRQKRVGLNLKTFVILKFRTMKIKTPSSSTHLIDTSNITPSGYFLRKFKIDEFPQLWNVLKGDMSLVGPRPCLLNQKKLINERKKRKVFKVRPGITGLSQVSDINMSKPILLAKTDLKMINKMNLFYYYYYIIITFLLIFKKKP